MKTTKEEEMTTSEAIKLIEKDDINQKTNYDYWYSLGFTKAMSAWLEGYGVGYRFGRDNYDQHTR